MTLIVLSEKPRHSRKTKTTQASWFYHTDGCVGQQRGRREAAGRRSSSCRARIPRTGMLRAAL
eukprot:6370612-Pyramimonas_sp.AAC.1